MTNQEFIISVILILKLMKKNLEQYAELLITGPFSILLGFDGGLMALNDRLKLRSMVAAEKGDTTYFASEESAIRVIQPDLDRVWSPAGGEPVIVRLNNPQGV